MTDAKLSYYLQELDGFYRITTQELKEMHYNGGYTHHDMAEKFGVSVGEFSQRLSKAGVARLCDTCREEMTSPGPAPEYCSEECRTFANGGSVVCSDCGEEIRTIGRWRSHDSHESINEHYQRFSESIDCAPDVKWETQRKVALHRADGVCEVCGREEELEVHHIIKRRVFDDERTSHALENLCVLCTECHGRLENKPIREVMAEVLDE